MSSEEDDHNDYDDQNSSISSDLQVIIQSIQVPFTTCFCCFTIPSHRSMQCNVKLFVFLEHLINR